jgi:DNA-binding NarL/FixJ family response regulator
VEHKILVVDDNQQIRRIIRTAIERRPGFLVVGEAENGKIAVMMVGTHKPHLVLLDLSMPVMNGLEAAREISKISPGMPMIMFTMYDHDQLREVAKRAGITHVFPKLDGMGDHVFDAMNALLRRPAA